MRTPVYNRHQQFHTVSVKDIYAVQGGPRSGHNAIMHWLAAHVADAALLCVNHSKFGPDQKRYPGIGGNEGGLKRNTNCYFYSHGHRIAIDLFNSEISDVDVLLFRNEWEVPDCLEFGIDCKKIYIIRDIRNQMASIQKGHRWILDKPGYWGRLLAGWVQYNMIQEDDDHIKIWYDLWCMSERYRTGILNRLCACFTNIEDPKTREFVPNQGSSFNNMDTVNRWQQYQEEPWFKQMMNWPGIEQILEDPEWEPYG